MSKEAWVSSLISAGICPYGQIKGCSPQEVSSLEQSVGFQLPSEYKEFLRAFGNGAGQLFQGTSFFYPGLAELQGDAAYLMEANGQDPLPENAFVFLMHQGYAMNFFKASEGDDPPVYQYVASQGPPVLACSSFSEFLKGLITHQGMLMRSRGSS